MRLSTLFTSCISSRFHDGLHDGAPACSGEKTLRSAKKCKASRLVTKSMISPPTDFKHLTHMDADHVFMANNVQRLFATDSLRARSPSLTPVTQRSSCSLLHVDLSAFSCSFGDLDTHCLDSKH